MRSDVLQTSLDSRRYRVDAHGRVPPRGTELTLFINSMNQIIANFVRIGNLGDPKEL
jgi:hypothetical protein